jgi:hypothetical protein
VGRAGLRGVVDGCNLFRRSGFAAGPVGYTGIGRGVRQPEAAFTDFVYDSFRVVERGVANELARLIGFLNEHFAGDRFNQVEFGDVQRLAGTCVTGCQIADPATVGRPPVYRGFVSRLSQLAAR